MRYINGNIVYGDVPPEIKSLFVDILNKEERPMKKKNFVGIMIAAILIMVFTCSALALGVRYSQRQSVINTARSALIEHYSFAPESLGLFSEDVQSIDGIWTITFTPTKYSDRLGIYTVQIDTDKEVTVHWTYEDEVFENITNGYLSGEIWGVKQIEFIQKISESYNEKLSSLVDEKGEMMYWTFEERAELDKMLLDAGFPFAEEGISINLLPADDDISQEKALSLAEQAIYDKYGVSSKEMSQYYQFVYFQISPNYSDNTLYHFQFDVHPDRAIEPLDSFSVYLDSKTGNILLCYWSVNADRFKLPEGPLNNYRQALEEYFAIGAFDCLGVDEKARLAERITIAGHADLLEGIKYEKPEVSLLREDDAFVLAMHALKDVYGIDESMLVLFSDNISFVEENGPQWIIEYSPNRVRSNLGADNIEKIGSYRVRISGVSGEVLEISWSMEEAFDKDVEYTENDWGSAPAWSSAILPWVMALEDQVAPIRTKLNTTGKLSAEESIEYANIMRSAGFTEYKAASPLAGELAEDEAYSIAIQAIVSEYNMTKERLEAYKTVYGFIAEDDTNHYWWFELYSTDRKEDMFRISIDAKTGYVLLLEYVEKGQG